MEMAKVLVAYDTETRQSTYEERPIIAYCLWCGEPLYDGAKESGWTGVGPDWCSDNDYGCDRSPDSGEDGVGAHTPNVLVTADGHVVSIPQGGSFGNGGSRGILTVIGHPADDDAAKPSRYETAADRLHRAIAPAVLRQTAAALTVE